MMKRHIRSLCNIVEGLGREVVTGVEVGVWRGELSEALLRQYPKLGLVMVDPWLPNEDDPITLQHDIREAQEIALARTAFAADRRTMLETTSLNAAAGLSNFRFDFVFIDACHQYRFVKEDIQAWWPLVKPGGILCGHDYRQNKRKDWGVVQAVDEFAASYNREVIKMPGNVWWVFKEKNDADRPRPV
jgi:SAM-dependent methyltransferase